MPARGNRRSERRTFKGRVLDCSLTGDPRNHGYRLGAWGGFHEGLPKYSTEWICPEILDQGREGACVGFAGAHFYGSERLIQHVTPRIARAFYKGAQERDEWPGEDYEGTSVNGLMSFLRGRNLIGQYRWIRSREELDYALMHLGPVIVGCEWRDGCFTPDRKGFIRFTGEVRGGHATCWRGIDLNRQCYIIQQSWGRNHGDRGTVYLPFSDVDEFFRTSPQVVFPEKKALKMDLVKTRPWWQFWK